MVASVDHFGDVVANPLSSVGQLRIGSKTAELVRLLNELCIAVESREKGGREGGREGEREGGGEVVGREGGNGVQLGNGNLCTCTCTVCRLHTHLNWEAKAMTSEATALIKSAMGS